LSKIGFFLFTAKRFKNTDVIHRLELFRTLKSQFKTACS